MKQKRVWMEVFELGDRFAFQPEKYLTKDQFFIFAQIQDCFMVQLRWLVPSVKHLNQQRLASFGAVASAAENSYF